MDPDQKFFTHLIRRIYKANKEHEVSINIPYDLDEYYHYYWKEHYQRLLPALSCRFYLFTFQKGGGTINNCSHGLPYDDSEWQVVLKKPEVNN